MTPNDDLWRNGILSGIHSASRVVLPKVRAPRDDILRASALTG